MINSAAGVGLLAWPTAVTIAAQCGVRHVDVRTADAGAVVL